MGELVQLAGESTHVSCRIHPGVFGVHEMVALLGDSPPARREVDAGNSGRLSSALSVPPA